MEDAQIKDILSAAHALALRVKTEADDRGASDLRSTAEAAHALAALLEAIQSLRWG